MKTFNILEDFLKMFRHEKLWIGPGMILSWTVTNSFPLFIALMYTHWGLIRYAAFTSLLRHDEFLDKHLGVADVQAS